MSNNSDIVFTPAARQAQAERGAAQIYEKRAAAGFPATISGELAAFIAERDTAFLATVSASGAPYIQHRGGPKGFIKVLDEKTLGLPTLPGTGSTSRSATSPAMTAPICSCSTLPSAGASRSGDVRGWWRTILPSSRGSPTPATAP